MLTINKDKQNISDLVCKLIKENPLLCARVFDHRVKSLFIDQLLPKALSIGKFIDVDCAEYVFRLIDKHITCQMPNSSENPKLLEIVILVQMRSKNHPKSYRKHSTTCYFKFSRPSIHQTLIARPDPNQLEVNNMKEAKVPLTDKLDEKTSPT